LGDTAVKIDQQKWISEVGAVIRVTTDPGRRDSAEAAQRHGLDASRYAALCVLQYLLDHHGDDLEVVSHGAN
jgi:hypothetical protein